MNRMFGYLLVATTVLMAGCLGGGGTETDLDPDELGENTVVYNSTGFYPRTITVGINETVTWHSAGPSMWVASDQHPSHTEYSGTSLNEHCTGGSSETFDACSDMDEYSFTFEKGGEWTYHNHLLSSHTGVVIVE